MLRKFIITLAVILTALTGIAATGGSASANWGSPKCMTKSEWRQIKNDMTRTEVKRIVGTYGVQTDRTDYSDDTFNISVNYRQCRPNSNKPASRWNTVYISYSTEVTYGDYVWDEYATWVDGHCVAGTDPWGDYDSCYDYSSGYYSGGYVWDDWAETGVTVTPRLDYKGSWSS